ncbi:spindle pole body component 110-like [Nicotiana sylvestris]|uniref:spindle pole body component 110-like n=1 Tax=Nicotiana sylvestris TaxID=4096 RepID=UPI00388CCCFF
MANIYHQDPEFQVFREGLKHREDQLECKIEELRERDKELMKVVARNSELEVSLKAKEDELELSRGVTAENADLQAKVVDLTTGLSTKVAEIEGLKGELNVSADKLAAAISESVSLEDALRISRSELTEEKKASGHRVAGLEGRVKELEPKLTAINGQMALLWAEDTCQRSQPSMSRASTDPVVPRHLCELWVHAEARLDAYKAFHTEGRATKAEV